jgi:hypothetical protein
MEQPSSASPSVGEWQTVLACRPTSSSAPRQRRGPACALPNHSCGCSQMLHGGRGLQQAIASRRPGEAVARAAHCCVGAAVVGVEDGTAIGARVGAVVVGLRMRTSVGAIPCRHFRVATIDPFAQKRRGSCVRRSNRARHRRRWESGKLCWPADRRVPVHLGSGAG